MNFAVKFIIQLLFIPACTFLFSETSNKEDYYVFIGFSLGTIISYLALGREIIDSIEYQEEIDTIEYKYAKEQVLNNRKSERYR